MRIAFDYQTFVRDAYGGISRYFARLAQGLHGLENQVQIFAPLHRNSYLSALPQEIVSGHFMKQFPPKTVRLLHFYNHLTSRYKITAWQPGVMHETYYSHAGTGPKQCPTVVTVHDMIHELFPSEFPAHDKTTEAKRRAIERADQVICVSNNTKQDLIRLLGTPDSKISVVHHGFDEFTENVEELLDNSYGEKKFLLYVGQRGGYKNFSSFLKAVASSKKLLADFDVIAFGGGGFSNSELSMIVSLGFAKNQVRQMSGDDALLGSCYRTATAFVYPSLYEGFGIPPLEAMAHRCPVICSNTSSMPEVIGSAAEFFDPTNMENMCSAIEAAVYSDSRLIKLRIDGIARLRSFSWDKCARETLNVYRRIA